MYTVCFRHLQDTKIGKIEAFIAKHENIDLTYAKLEELEKLNMALKEQWGCMAAAWDDQMVSSEDPEILMELDKLVLATGKVVDDTLVNSGQLIKESLARILDAVSPAEAAPVMIREGAREVCDGATPVVVLEDDREVCEVREVHEVREVRRVHYCFKGCARSPEESVTAWWTKKKANATEFRF